MCRLSWNLGSSTSWNPPGLSRSVMGLLYLFIQLEQGIRLLGWKILCSHPDRKEKFFCSPKPIKLALEPTQPLLQWVPKALYILVFWMCATRPAHLIFLDLVTWKIPHILWGGAARGGAVGWGTALQTGRSRVRFLMVSLEFFIDIILPAALWPWGRLSL